MDREGSGVNWYRETYGNVTVFCEREDLLATQQACPEDEKIRELVEAGYDCRRGTEASWPVLYHLSHLRGNLTEWLPIGPEHTVLEFGADTGQLTGGLVKKAGRVVCLEESVRRSRILAKRHESAGNLAVYAGDPWNCLERLLKESGGGYDWILAVGLLQQAGRYFPGEHPEEEALRRLFACLKPGGHMVLAADNRFGLKYWAGAMEPHTGGYFDSLEGRGSTFSRRELERILKESGCGKAVFYYPYPERWFPSAIYSDQWLPKAGELNHNLRNFEGERLVLFQEEKVYDQLIRDGRYPEFANTFLCVVGPQQEEQTVYCKYSNDRADRFMLRTDIIKNTEGYEVRKIPLTEEAKVHVRKMKQWEETLDERYRKNGIRANRCTLRGDAAAFEFLEGNTFEERLDALRRSGDAAGLVSEVLRFRTLLLETLRPELKPFAKSSVFVEMFGNPEFTKAYEGAKTNNLDWIFANLMETEEGIRIIDYEWTFQVQVPVEYLFWRALSLYMHSREDVKGLGLMAQAGISPGEEQLFEEMEHHFQLWLLDGTRTVGAQYLATAGPAIALSDMLKQVNKNRIQVYLDTGNGLSEAESFWIGTRPDKLGIVHLEILLPPGVQALRLDPAECTCLVKVRRLLGELNGTYPLEYTHNGRELEKEGILYTTTDPQIHISGIVPGTGRLCAELTVEELYPDTAYACMNLLNRVRSAERLYGSAPFRFLKKLRRIVKK